MDLKKKEQETVFHLTTNTLESKPGVRTTLNMFLPRAASEMALKARALSPFPQGSERILFIGDESYLSGIEVRVLEHFGYHVTQLTNSINALEAFRSEPGQFDLIITNQTMRNMTGEMLARVLTKIGPDVPIILCAGRTEAISEEEIKALGIKKLLIEPVSVREISETIRQVLDQ
jgi:CheY-like chemotaxis protein